MSEARAGALSVRILEKEYSSPARSMSAPRCSMAPNSSTTACAKFATAARCVGLDRIAVMAALNLAHEFLKGRDRETKLDSGVGHRVRALRERVESALEKSQQLEL